jgi:glyoxylase-like metal-dependent hydrolase (beta-lactamase superfamily II)
MTYLLSSIEGNRQRLDGGAMFGNVPRALWADWIPPDDKHRIPLACRAFLLEDASRGQRILLEAGIGLFFEPKLQERFGVMESEHRLLHNLAALGVRPEEIDGVVLSHLHFDHAGGLLSPWRADGPAELVFPRARFLVGRRAWERAKAPHLRDRASFIPRLLELLERSGRLELCESATSDRLGPGFSFFFSEGHTPGLMLTTLQTEAGSMAFCGDLIPGRPWIHLPVTMGYDRYPERLIEEKQRFLETCLNQNTRLLFTHDPDCALCGVAQDERGRFVATNPVEAICRISI